MYGRKSRIVKLIAIAVGVLCLAVGIVSLAAGVASLIRGNTAEIAASKEGLTHAVYIISVYLTPVFAVLSVAAYVFAGTGLRCGSLEKTATRLCASGAAACIAAFIFWLVI